MLAGIFLVVAYLLVGVVVDFLMSLSGLGETGDVSVILLWPFLVAFVLLVLLINTLEKISGKNFLVAAIVAVSSTAHAAPPVACHQQRVIQQQAVVRHNVVKQQAVLIPSAIQSVLVQHAAIPAFYTYQNAASNYSQTQSIESAENTELLREIRDLLASGAGGAVRTAANDPLFLVRQKCSKCHSGPAAKGGFHTDGDMSSEDRMLAISRILSDDAALRMPKGQPLDAATMGKVLQQLSKKPVSDSPPPNPERDE